MKFHAGYKHPFSLRSRQSLLQPSRFQGGSPVCSLVTPQLRSAVSEETLEVSPYALVHWILVTSNKKGRNNFTIQDSERKTPSSQFASTPPSLLPILSFFFVCFNVLISPNVRTAWQEDRRTARQKRYSIALSCSSFNLWLFVCSWHLLFLQKLIIPPLKKREKKRKECVHEGEMSALCFCPYLALWHPVMSTSPTQAKRMRRSMQFTLECGCEDFTC